MEGFGEDSINVETPQNLPLGPSWSGISFLLNDDGGESEVLSALADTENLPEIFDPPPLPTDFLTPDASSNGEIVNVEFRNPGIFSGASKCHIAPYFFEGVRDVLKSIKVNKYSIHQAIERFGGGEQGMRLLVEYIMFCAKESSTELTDVTSIVQGINYLCIPQAPQTDFLSTDHDGSSSPTAVWENSYRGHPCGSQHVWEQRGRKDGQCHDLDSRRLGMRAEDTEPVMPDVSLGSVQVRNFNTHPVAQLARSSDPCLHQPSEIRSAYARMTQTTARTRAIRRDRMACRRGQQSRPRRHSRTAPRPGPTLGTQGNVFGKPSRLPSDISDNERSHSLTFLFYKELRPSDVSSLGRIVLPKKEATCHLPFLARREGITLSLEDYHTGRDWSFRFRFWPNNKSRMYLFENTGEFVRFHHLQEEDQILLYKKSRGTYVIRIKRSLKPDGADYGAEGKEDVTSEGGVPKKRKPSTKSFGFEENKCCNKTIDGGNPGDQNRERGIERCCNSPCFGTNLVMKIEGMV